jgi:hypothetical protein
VQMRESAQICFGRTRAIGTSNRSGGMGQKRGVRERNRRKHVPMFRKHLYIPHQAAALNRGDYLTGHDVLCVNADHRAL